MSPPITERPVMIPYRASAADAQLRSRSGMVFPANGTRLRRA